jgi:hypothetical protein
MQYFLHLYGADMANEIGTKYARYIPGWIYKPGAFPTEGARVTPSEYLAEMEGEIFCPECFVPLFRSPKERERSKAGKAAFFAHSRKYRPECSLRTKPTLGKRYENEEDARQAIADGRLVILQGFIQNRPELPQGVAGEYDQGPVEDLDGELARVPIARHRGESFFLPSKIATVVGLCRNFDSNYDKYFIFPNSQYAVPLRDLLLNVEDVTETTTLPRLYFGKITGSYKFFTSGKNKTSLMHSQPGVQDFCLKLDRVAQEEKGISNDSKGRVVIMYGCIRTNGTGLCLTNLGYGEFGLLPVQYESLLYPVEKYS